MKYSLALVLIMALLTSTAHARFAKFVLVAPGVELDPRSKEYAISTNPVLSIVQSDTNTFTVTIPLKNNNPQHQYWLIRCKSTLNKEQMEFRDYVWGISKRSDIETTEVIQLTPDQKSITLQIPANTISRTYLYRD